jgi:hypothetical protein
VIVRIGAGVAQAAGPGRALGQMLALRRPLFAQGERCLVAAA